jgi:hypothetical protein
MSVIFAVIGAVIGIMAAMSNDFSIAFGALVGGVGGVALARLLQKRSPRVANEPAPKPVASDNLNHPADSPSGELPARVEQLEREIVVLRGEIRELRASVTGAWMASWRRPNCVQPMSCRILTRYRPLRNKSHPASLR